MCGGHRTIPSTGVGVDAAIIGGEGPEACNDVRELAGVEEGDVSVQGLGDGDGVASDDAIALVGEGRLPAQQDGSGGGNYSCEVSRRSRRCCKNMLIQH